jgi:hypothetical protein
MSTAASGSEARQAMPQAFEDLDILGEHLWRELGRASQDRHHEWRQPVLATLCPEEGPQARTVVLREVDVSSRTLLIYTDARSPKVAQLQSDPRASLVCWSRSIGWQLRLGGRIEVRADGLDVTSRWALMRHTRSAMDYLSPRPPGTVVQESGLAQVSSLTTVAPRAHFAVLRLQVERMDWLALGPGGHRRARFDVQGEALSGHWCCP